MSKVVGKTTAALGGLVLGAGIGWLAGRTYAGERSEKNGVQQQPPTNHMPAKATESRPSQSAATTNSRPTRPKRTTNRSTTKRTARTKKGSASSRAKAAPKGK